MAGIMYYGNRIRFPRHRSADARITWLGNIPLVDVLQSNISHLCSSPSHRQQDYDPFCSIGGRFTSSSNALFSSAFSNSKLAPAKSYQGYPEGQTVGCRVWCWHICFCWNPRLSLRVGSLSNIETRQPERSVVFGKRLVRCVSVQQ